jgi:hypothetical protein
MRKLVLCVLLLCASVSSARPLADGDPGETARIRRWLSHVEAFLRSREVSHLSASQRMRRAVHLQHLHEYWKAGRFPHNHVRPGLMPVFIDEHGTACAVGYLLLEGGAAELARQIARDQLLARLPEIHSPALARWAVENGFRVEELALIQPSYRYKPTEERVCLSYEPTVFRYDQGWQPAWGPMDEFPLRDAWEYPWLEPGEGGELLLLSRKGAVQVWDGSTFTSLLREHWVETAATAALPHGKKGAILALPRAPRQKWPFTFEVGENRLPSYGEREEGTREVERFTGDVRPELYSLWTERGTGTVFGVGRDGVIVRRTPYESWVVLSTPSKAPLLDIEGTGSTDLWAVGGGGTALHFDGTQWQQVETGTQEGLIAVAASAPDDVWAVGTRGTVLHFDGTAWKPVDTGVSSTLRAVTVHGGEVWLGGDNGVVLHRKAEGWRREDTPTAHSIMSFGAAGNRLFATTNAQTGCHRYLSAIAVAWYTRPSMITVSPYKKPLLNAPLVLLGHVQARIHQLTGLQPPLTLSMGVLGAIPLAWCVRAARRRPRRTLAWAVGLPLVVLSLGGVFITARQLASYRFELKTGASDSNMREGELARIQDWLLLQHDLGSAPIGKESQRGVAPSWSMPEEFIQHADDEGNARDAELRARYSRLLSTGPLDPFSCIEGFHRN